MSAKKTGKKPTKTQDKPKGSPGHPSVYLTQNQSDSHQRNPSWCVAFIRFNEVSAMHTTSSDLFAEKKALIIENDCVGVSINNPKGSFAKTCSLSMKVGEIWYQNAVSCGDWVFVWMSDSQDHIDRIVEALYGSGKESLNGFNSGLKFIGRVISTDNSDVIDSTGHRTIYQNVHCQAFLEMNTSIYYTFLSQSVIEANNKENQVSGNINFVKKSISDIQKSNGMGAALTKLGEIFDNYYKNSADTAPETIIGMLFTLIMGIEKEKNLANSLGDIKGSFSDAIGIPKTVANIMGIPEATKLWELYTLYLGLQKYSSKRNTLAGNLSPDFSSETDQAPNSVFYRTPYPTKGYVPFYMPPIWDNNTFWGVLSQFVHPIVNEMYTALRINKDGQIRPTLIVREQPFSTGLYNYLYQKAPEIIKVDSLSSAPPNAKAGETNQKQSAQSAIKEKIQKAQSSGNKTESIVSYDEKSSLKKDTIPSAPGPKYDNDRRTFFHNLPRWVVDESALHSINVSTDEGARVNFVQVWGRSQGLEFNQAKIDQEQWKIIQFMSPNYVSDDRDIKRHGLRADISESQFDMPSNDAGTLTHLFCRMRADWLFNGHLKLNGTASLHGIVEPIVEGDNAQIRGVLYHIEGVSHNGVLGVNGQKTFTTTLQLSRGVLANEFDKDSSLPRYAKDLPESRAGMDTQKGFNLPGSTDLQATSSRKGRDVATGEKIKAPENTGKKKKKNPLEKLKKALPKAKRKGK
jgi:hypothetical protein